MDLYQSWFMPDQAPNPRLAQQPTSSPTMPVDDWPPQKDRTPAPAQPANSPSAPSAPTLDLSDFTTLDDIAGPGASATMMSPTSFYGSYNFFMPYSSSFPAWPASSSVPVSSYSSLNGATNPPPGSVPQVPSPQQPSTSSTMVVDPAQHQFPYSSQPSTQQTPYSFAQSLHPYTTSYYRQPHATSSQGTLSPQVLHPTSMMATASGMHPAVFYGQSLPPPSSSTPSSFTVSTVPTVTPQQQQQIQEQQARERKERFEKNIRALLLSSAFTGAQAVQTLVDKISDYGSHEVESAMRLEILTKMRDGAPNHYFRAWSENPGAIEITREWLKATFKGDKPQLSETIMPLLHIIDRLPFTVESLKASKLGKIVVHLVKDAPSPAIKDMASNLERRWRQMVSSANADSKSTSENNAGEVIDSGRSKKRKLNEPSGSSKSAATATASSSNSLPPLKKPAVGTSSSTKPLSATVKKEAKGASSSTAGAVKAAGTDTSFFSAPKSKAKLPSFKKALVPKASSHDMDTDPNVAQPSSVDPFQEALKMMKVRRDSPAVSTPPAGTGTPPNATSGKTGGGKKKSVTWAADSALESIRYIERAVYDDDVKDATHVSLRDLDRGEGAALHAHIFEEAIDWSEPYLLDLPEDVKRPRGGLSEEKDTQEKREQTALGALYMNASQIPDSPAEPLTVLLEEEVDATAAQMTAGEENDAFFWSGGPNMMMMIDPAGGGSGMPNAAAQAILSAPAPAVVQLLEMIHSGGMLQSTATSTTAQAAPAPGGGGGGGGGVDLSYGLGTPSLQSLIQQLQGPVPAGSYGGGYGEEWAADYGYHDELDHSGRQWDGQGRGGRGRGGRGRGGARGGGGGGGSDDGYRHNKRKPCSFFAQGRCKFGDQCDFAHEG